MQPGRRRLLRTVGVTSTAAVTGCLGTLDSLFATGPDRSGYTRWLVAPGTIVPADRYRFGSVRPRHVTDRDRIDQFLPSLEATGIPLDAVRRVVVGNGGFGVSGTFEQGTVVATLRSHGYDYVDGVGNAWILAPTTGDHPVYAVDDGHLAVGYPTETRDAHRVAATLVRARNTDSHWTTTHPAIEALTTVLGDPPVLTAALHDPHQTTAPARGVFTAAVGWGIAEQPAQAAATIAVLFADAATVPTTAVQTWATQVFDDPAVDTSGRVVTVTTDRPQTSLTRLPVPDQAWPMSGADPTNTATVPDTRPPNDPVHVRWLTSVEVSGTVTSPVVTGDTITLGAGDLFAIDATDGTERWRVDTTVTGTPAIDATTVIAPTERGVLAVNRADGTERWRRPTSTRPQTATTRLDDHVVVGTRTGLLVLDAATGTGTVIDTPVSTVPAVADDTIYTHTDARTLQAITIDGTRRWHHRFPARVQDAPVVDDDHVYVVTPGTVHALDRTDGTVDWTAAFDTRLTAAPAVVDDHLIVGESRPGTSDPGALSVFATDDGHRRWTRALPRAVVGQPAVAGDQIHVAGAAGTVSVHALTDGKEHYARTLGGSLHPPTVVDDQLIASTFDGRVTSLEPHWLPGPPSQFDD